MARKLFLLMTASALILAPARAEERNYPGMKVWSGENGKGVKKDAYGRTSYWIQRNGSEDLGKKVKGEIYVRDEKAIQRVRGTA